MQFDKRFRVVLAVVLVAILLYAGLSKLEHRLAFGVSNMRQVAYLLGAVGEVVLAGLVIVPATRRLSVSMVAATFLGMLAASVVLIMRHGFTARCNCLGHVQTSRGLSLVVQGVVLALCAALSAAWERSASEPGHTQGVAGS